VNVERSAEASAPTGEYGRRRDTWQATQADLLRRYSGLVRWRNVALGVLAAFLWHLAGAAGRGEAPVLLTPAAGVLLALIVWRNRVGRAAGQAARVARYYERRLECLHDRWAGHGNPGTHFLDPEHPAAADLDLFGPGSVFERLCTARTSAGAATLAAWLTAPGRLEEIRERQAAVDELRPRLDLREALAVRPMGTPDRADLRAFGDWAGGRVVFPPGARVAGLAVAALALASVVAWAGGLISPGLVLTALLLEGGFGLWLRGRVRQILAPIESQSGDLAALAQGLTSCEDGRFTTTSLARLRDVLGHGARHASAEIGRLARVTCWLGARHNLVLGGAGCLVLWTTQLALAAEAWRRRNGRAVADWLKAAGAFEALAALAGYAYENPVDPFPELVADLRPALGEGQILEVRPDLGPGRLDGLDDPALGEGVVKLLLRHPPRPLRARLLVAEAEQEQPSARLQDGRQPLNVGPAVFVAEDMEQAAVDHVVEPLRPVLEGQGVHDQEGRGHALVG
jgi:hypothetical protein